MLSQERYRKIMDVLEECQSIKVVEMAQLLNVSVDTIRRDLKHLEQKRLLIRTHGGAVLNDIEYENRTIPERLKMMTSSKVNLGKEILHELKDGDTLFLDGSTTTMLLIPSLKQFKRLTIITNSMYTGIEVLEKQIDADLHVLGGKILDPIGSVVGIEALRSLESYKIDKAILSSYAVDENGFYDVNSEEARFKREVTALSGHTYYLMDASKLEAKAPMFIHPLSESITLILEKRAFETSKARVIVSREVRNT